MGMKRLAAAAAVAAAANALPSSSSGGAVGLAPDTSAMEMPVVSQLQHVSAGKEVLYAVSTGKEMHDTRARGVFHTWCSPLQACVFYSDAENPKNTPTTIPMKVEGTDSTDPFRLAQLRYLRILRHATVMVTSNHLGLFDKNRWLIVTDDDTYVLHYNLHRYLKTLDSQAPLYTGHTLPPYVYPVDDDGHGHKLGSAVRTHFACGGGGSVFSHGALTQLEGVINSCVVDTTPGHFMSDWNSDWMIGECAHRANVTLIEQEADRFGQFVYGDDKQQLQPTDLGRKMYCVKHEGRCAEPLSLHPVHEPIAMRTLWARLPNSTSHPVQNIAVRLKDDGDVEVY